MARKKFYKDDLIPINPNKADTTFRTALYIRLSREDGDKIESDSVTNQRNLLSNYANEKADFEIIDTYIDDGYTGTNFDRPGFNRMLEDIKSGKVNCVIVKDLSRFGRDYIQAGNYLEQLFPFLKCRFISILDNLDSFERPNEIGSVFVRFKHIMNDHYSSEISKKLRYVYDKQRKEGKLVSSFAPYGYTKDPNDKHHLIIDDEIADIVRNIYSWYLQGMGVIRISQNLNNLRIIPPGVYRREKGLYKSNHSNCGSLWRPNTIRRILSNKVYIGCLEQKKKTTRNYKERTKIKLSKIERIFVPNTHEPIIDTKTFKKVQDSFEKCARTSPNEEKIYLFSGFLKCYDCNRAMIRTSKRSGDKDYTYYKCRTYNQISKDKCPQSHSISHELLVGAVLKAINTQIHAVVNMQNVIDKINNTDFTKLSKINFAKEIKKRKHKIKMKASLKKGLYEDWKSDVISKNDYISMKEAYDNETVDLENSIKKLEIEEKMLIDMQTQNIEWMNKFVKNYNIKELSRELLSSLIEKIYIDADKNIHIQFKYQDEYLRIIDYIKSHIQEKGSNIE